MESISDRIKRLLSNRQLTVYKICRETGIQQATFGRSLKTLNVWKTEHLMKIAAYFNVSLDWLILGKEYKESEYIEQLQSNILKHKKNLKELEDENKRLRKAMLILLEESEVGNKELINDLSKPSRRNAERHLKEAISDESNERTRVSHKRK